ncbi:MAG: cytochrome c [Actinobacteria bacterium]|nr:cytochrome c [Actinomycetota bacterium]
MGDRPAPARRRAGWGVALLALVLAGCGASIPESRSQQVNDGDPQFGEQALIDYGCVSCHHIPGVPGADAYVGPPLDRFGLRSYIAGSLTNTQPHLVRWIMSPQAVEPGTAMPDLQVSRQDALNMSAYLLGLE